MANNTNIMSQQAATQHINMTNQSDNCSTKQSASGNQQSINEKNMQLHQIILPKVQLNRSQLIIKLQKQIDDLYKAHSDAHLQKLLQQQIGTVKKKTSQLASVKKKLSAQTRNLSDANEQKRKYAALKTKGENTCRTLQQALKKRKELTAHFVQEMTNHRNDVVQRMKKGVQETQSKLDARKTALDEMNRQNSVLQKQLEAKKAAFDEACAKFKSGLTDRAKIHEQLLRGFGASTKQIEMLEAQLILIRRERDALQHGCALLQKQFEVYDEKFKTFAPTLTNPDDVANMAQRQRAQLHERITETEKQKNEAHELRLKLEKEITQLRGRQAILKKEIASAEKARSAAQRRCRQIQAQVINSK